MRRSFPAAAIGPILAVLALTACGGDSTVAATPDPTATTTGTPSEPPQPSDDPSLTASPPGEPPLPAGTTLLETDATADELTLRRLVPDATDLTGSWWGRVGGADVAVLAYAEPSDDPLRRGRGLWAWTERPDLGGWLGRELARYPPARDVLGLDVQVADVTGDANDDALAFALTGGSGACGRWVVFELEDGSDVFSRDLCDGRLDPSSDPVGLLLVESIFGPNDPHCCPSALRETVLTYEDGRDWRVASRSRTPLG
jgi:hypothetical protein